MAVGQKPVPPVNIPIPTKKKLRWVVHLPQSSTIIWLWVKNRYPKWLGTWRHGRFNLRSISWWFNFDPYPNDTPVSCQLRRPARPSTPSLLDSRLLLGSTSRPARSTICAVFAWEPIEQSKRTPGKPPGASSGPLKVDPRYKLIL